MADEGVMVGAVVVECLSLWWCRLSLVTLAEVVTIKEIHFQVEVLVVASQVEVGAFPFYCI